jgi:hypothetical protein
MAEVSPPIMFHSPETQANSAELTFYLTIVGDANRHLPYLIAVLIDMARHRLHKSGGHYRLKRVTELKEDCLPGQVLFADGNPLQHELRFPIRLDSFAAPFGKIEWLVLDIFPMIQLKVAGEITKDPDPVLLVHRLLRRMALLSAVYCGTEAENLEDYFQFLTEGLVLREDRSTQAEWTKRESGRFLPQGGRRRRVPIWGWKGEIVLESPRLDPLLPFFRLGALLGAGKLCGMGMGSFRLSVETGLCAEQNGRSVPHLPANPRF